MRNVCNSLQDDNIIIFNSFDFFILKINYIDLKSNVFKIKF